MSCSIVLFNVNIKCTSSMYLNFIKYITFLDVKMIYLLYHFELFNNNSIKIKKNNN